MGYKSIIFAAVLVGFIALSNVQVAESQTGVCYYTSFYYRYESRYYSYYYTYYYWCSRWGRWFRCSSSRITYVYYRVSVPVYYSYSTCCSGYQWWYGTCRPYCSACYNGGTCTAPYTCSCRSGYTGSTCLYDRNECAENTDNCQQNCHNTYGSYYCSCNSGYSSSGSSCYDIDECASGLDNCQHNCHNSVGSYTCSCNNGYYLSGNGRSCIDENECLDGSHNCQQQCENIDGGFRCYCDSGYQLNGNGRTCDDINECSQNTDLCEHDCANTVGSYTCSCRNGYRLAADGFSCVDINECSENTDNCGQVCTNTIGSFYCSCNDGYRLDGNGYTCNDINECAEGTSGCSQLCSNTIGSYQCSCNTGYRLDGDGHTCNDIDECAEGTHACAQICDNTIGSYTCRCNIGYTLNPDGRACDDIDECSLPDSSPNADTCEQNCHNNIGSYTCSCGDGYRLNPDGRNCDDIDECAEGTDQCEHNCHNTIGSYYCSCRIGYSLNADGFACDDINECLEPEGSPNRHECDQNCHNEIGSYTCSCNIGWLLADDGRTCLDIDECALDIDGCEHNCTNTQGSYFCSCYVGFRLNDDLHTCSDIDECVEPLDSDYRHQCDQNCHNNIGSYTCSCNIGWVLDEDGRRCNDIDECLPTGIGRHGDLACQQECVNTPGSYHCDCRDGYRILDDMINCGDIDECAEDLDECAQICLNNVGSYGCSCHSGYTLDPDGKGCNDINECLEGMPCGQGASCNNTIGSYMCSCPPGTTQNVDMSRCNDIDECDLNTHICEHDCENTVGSYVCFCSENHTQADDGISCLEAPSDVTVININSRGLMVSWSEYTDDAGTVMEFTLVCNSQEHGEFFLQLPVAADRTDHLVSNVRPATTYRCCLTVRTTQGDSPFACDSATTDEDTPDSPPSDITAAIDGPYSITAHWNVPFLPSGLITAYTLYIDYRNGQVVKRELGADVYSYKIDNLTPYQTIFIAMSANTTIGEGVMSGFLSATTSEFPPSVIESSFIVIDDNTARITWSPPAMPNGVLTQYAIVVYNDRTGYRQTTTRPGDEPNLSITLSDLTPNVPYTVEISALNSAGRSDLNPLIVFTKESTPVQPRITATPRLDGSGARITIQPISEDDAHGYLTKVDVAIREAESRTDDCSTFDPTQVPESELISFTTGLDDPHYQLEQLVADTEYCVAVRASTGAGSSPFSFPAKITLSEDTLFQVRLSLKPGTTCATFIDNNYDEGLATIIETIANYVLDNCECDIFSPDYLTDYSLTCVKLKDSEVIFKGRLLSTSDMSSGEVLSLVQRWLEAEHLLQTPTGTVLSVISYCNTSLDTLDGDVPVCFAPTPTDPPGSFGGGNTIILALEVVGGIGGAALLALIIFVPICIACCLCTRKDTRREIRENRRDDLVIENRRPSGVSEQALLTNAADVGTFKRGGKLLGTLPRSTKPVSDYDPSYGAAEDDDAIRKVDLAAAQQYNTKYDDGDDFGDY